MKLFTSNSLMTELALCSTSVALAQNAPVLPAPIPPARTIVPVNPVEPRFAPRSPFELAQVQPLEVERDTLAQAKAALEAVAADQNTFAFDQAKAAFDA